MYTAQGFKLKILFSIDVNIQNEKFTISISSHSPKISNVDRKVPLKIVGSSDVMNVKRLGST